MLCCSHSASYDLRLRKRQRLHEESTHNETIKIKEVEFKESKDEEDEGFIVSDPNKKRTFKCKQCHKTTSRKSEMKTHIAYHKKKNKKKIEEKQKYHYEVNVNCKECGEHFQDDDRHREHLKRHFNDDPDREWRRCNENGCDSTISYETTHFMFHLCSEHGYDKQYRCTRGQCPYRAATLSEMKKHSRVNKHFPTGYTVDGESVDLEKDCYTVSAECKLCGTGQTFHDFKSYQKHVSIHTMKVCECGEKKSARDFLEHLSAKHQWAKPFKCTQCSRSASSRKRMVTHWQKKHGLNIKTR